MTIESESADNTSSTNIKLQIDLQKIITETKKTEPITVSRCRHEDIEHLKAEMPYGPSNYHEMALQSQIDGESTYLIAHIGDRPVGHGNLLLDGPKESEVVDVLAGVPEINALEISQEYRSQGIGSEIISLAEEAARSYGKEKICIGVSEENPRARELYEKLGYTDKGLPRHKVTKNDHTFDVVYLVKDLTKNR